MQKTIALDADGVLLDYATAYAQAWFDAFGVRPQMTNPQAYFPREKWGLPVLEGDALAEFRAQFDSSFWSSLPALPGAVEACRDLHAAGYRLVVVSALPEEFAVDRHTNLLSHGFPVDAVYATPVLSSPTHNPKASVLQKLQPVAFVDDYLPYLRGISRSATHVALITREPYGSPNAGPELTLADSLHSDLPDFASWWLSGQ